MFSTWLLGPGLHTPHCPSSVSPTFSALPGPFVLWTTVPFTFTIELGWLDGVIKYRDDGYCKNQDEMMGICCSAIWKHLKTPVRLLLVSCIQKMLLDTSIHPRMWITNIVLPPLTQRYSHMSDGSSPIVPTLASATTASLSYSTATPPSARGTYQTSSRITPFTSSTRSCSSSGKCSRRRSSLESMKWIWSGNARPSTRMRRHSSTSRLVSGEKWASFSALESRKAAMIRELAAFRTKWVRQNRSEYSL